MLSDRRRPRFTNLNPTVSVDVVRVKSEVNNLFNSARLSVRVSVNKLDLAPKRIIPGLVGVFSVRSKLRDQYVSEERQGSLSLFQNEALVIFFKGCARGAREGERTEEPAAKALVFRFLRSLAVRRTLLAKNASWELVCHLNALFVSQWKLKSFCITQANTRAA